MIVQVGAVGEFTDYKYVVVIAFVGDRIVLCRHRDRLTWETPGGHIERGEAPREAAVRELYEEAGITARTLSDLGDYRVGDVTGRVFVAEVGARHPLPHFEMAETRDVEELPTDLTYPEIANMLVQHARAWRSQGTRRGAESADEVRGVGIGGS